MLEPACVSEVGLTSVVRRSSVGSFARCVLSQLNQLLGLMLKLELMTFIQFIISHCSVIDPGWTFEWYRRRTSFPTLLSDYVIYSV